MGAPWRLMDTKRRAVRSSSQAPQYQGLDDVLARRIIDARGSASPAPSEILMVHFCARSTAQAKMY
jgi:hypothetical protein